MSTSMTAAPSRIRALAALAAAGCFFIASFQLALALGAPLGRAAWGGTNEHLPASLRIASAVATGIWLFGGLIVLRTGGFPSAPLSVGVVRWGMRVLVAVLSVGGLMNLASSSAWERYFWAPLAAAVAALCFLLMRDTRRAASN